MFKGSPFSEFLISDVTSNHTRRIFGSDPLFSVFGRGEEGCMYGTGAVPSHGKRLCVLGPPE